MALPSIDPSITSPTGTPVIASAYNDKLQAPSPQVNQTVQAQGQASNVHGASSPAVLLAPAPSVGSGSTTAANSTPGNTIVGQAPASVGGTNSVTVGGIVGTQDKPEWTGVLIPALIAAGVLLFLEYR